jgi:hypothetical protein
MTTVPPVGGRVLAVPAEAWRLPVGSPRASEQALWFMGKLCLLGFLAAQFVSLTRLFWSQRLGAGALGLATVAGIASVALLLPAATIYGLRADGPLGNLVDGARLWAVLVLGLSLLLFFYGWVVKEYRLNPVVHDLCPYLVIVGAVVLGSIDRVFADLDRPLLALLLVALVVNALGMTEITDVVSEIEAEDRAGPAIVGYRTQGALAFWPLLFLTARKRRPLAAFLVYSAVFFVLAQQILFQKRGPSVRILLFVVVFLFVLPRLVRPRPREGRRSSVTFASAGALALVVSLAAAPWLFEGQLAGLVRRLSGQAYEGGAAGMLTYENERFFEAGMFLRTLEPQELLLGRGFGGYFIPQVEGWGGLMDDLGVVARRQLHVGGLMPLFKGGLALFASYFAALASALVRGRRFLAQPLAAAAFFVLVIHALYLTLEGWFIMSSSFDLLMVGLCMGYLLSRERDTEESGPRPAQAFGRPAP